MKKNIFPSAFIIALFPILASCSIRQDRSLCPDKNMMTMLRLDLRSTASDFKFIHMRIYDSEKVILQKTIRTDVRDPYDTTFIPLKDMKYTLWASKTSSAIIAENSYNLLEAIPSDSLYADCGELYALDAPWTEKAVLHKQFMTLLLNFSLSRDMSASIQIPTSEISFHEIEPTGRPRTMTVPISEKGTASVRIPRQKDHPEILVSTPIMKDTLDISRALEAMHYNWNAPDLHDVLLEVDEGHSSFRISVLPWNRGCDMSLRLSSISPTN